MIESDLLQLGRLAAVRPESRNRPDFERTSQDLVPSECLDGRARDRHPGGTSQVIGQFGHGDLSLQDILLRYAANRVFDAGRSNGLSARAICSSCSRSSSSLRSSS